MLIFLNGDFVPEDRAVISVFDRGFLYGDGLFETMLVRKGRPFRWDEHWERLQQGAGYLQMKLPFESQTMRAAAGELAMRNELPDGLLRLTLSRGVGRRGYSPSGADQPTAVMTLHPLPPELVEIVREPGTHRNRLPRWSVITASPRLPAGDRLAQFKSCNKLAQILARIEAEAAGADEALLLNTDGFVVEGASSNLFWIKDGIVWTPPLLDGVLAGVTRSVVAEICQATNVPLQEGRITLPELRSADALFMSLSSFGVVGVSSLEGAAFRESGLLSAIQESYWRLVEFETNPS